MGTDKKRRQYGTGGLSQRTSDGMWIGKIQAGWTPQGKRRVITVSAKTKPAAKKKLDDKLRDIARDGLPTAGVNGRATVESWSKVWLPMHERKVRPSTYTTDAGTVRKWINPTIGNVRLADLTPGHLRKLRDAITDAGRSSTTALHSHKILLIMLKAAVVEGHRVPDRIFKVPKPSKASNDRDAIPLPDAITLLQAISDRPDAARWVAALLQGMRQGECLGLTWSRVDLDNHLIDVSWQLQRLPYKDRAAETFRVPDGFEATPLPGAGAAHLTRPKTQAGRRVIPLVPWMVRALTDARERWLPNPWDLVWCDELKTKQRPCVPSVDLTAWHDVQKAAGIGHPAGRPYHLHEARHTTASLLAAAGVDRSVIERILGQAVLVDAYLHTDLSQVRDAMNLISARLQLT